MTEQVTWLKDALDTKKLVPHLAYYFMKEGRLYATTGKMTASIPFPYYDGTLLVSGKEFEQVVKSAPEGAKLEITPGGRASIKAGKFKAHIPVLDPELWPLEKELASYEALPKDFLRLAEIMRPFISENATKMWAATLALTAEGMWSTNNISVVHAPLETGIEGERQVLLPEWAVDFLLGRQDGLEEWGWDDGSAYFSWKNGGRMKTQLVNEVYPTAQIQLMLGKTSEPSHQITEEWRKTLQRLSTLAGSQDIVLFEAVASFGGEDSLFVEDGLETPVPAGGFSCWPSEDLSKVMKVATHWDPTKWPQPARFRSASLTGLVASKNRT